MHCNINIYTVVEYPQTKCVIGGNPPPFLSGNEHGKSSVKNNYLLDNVVIYLYRSTLNNIPNGPKTGKKKTCCVEKIFFKILTTAMTTTMIDTDNNNNNIILTAAVWGMDIL